LTFNFLSKKTLLAGRLIQSHLLLLLKMSKPLNDMSKPFGEGRFIFDALTVSP